MGLFQSHPILIQAPLSTLSNQSVRNPPASSRLIARTTEKTGGGDKEVEWREPEACRMGGGEKESRQRTGTSRGIVGGKTKRENSLKSEEWSRSTGNKRTIITLIYLFFIDLYLFIFVCIYLDTFICKYKH